MVLSYKMRKITFVLTSCGRVKLLNKTLDSFFKFNDYKLEKMYLVEDSFDQNVYSQIKKKWGNKLTLLFNEKKRDKSSQLLKHIS